MIERLPFPQIWLVDTEFNHRWPDGLASSEQIDGNPPVPVCLVAKEVRSGRVIRLWQDELSQLDEPPFPVDESSLFVAYAAAAELSCFDVLGWPFPSRILDLYIEYRAITSGTGLPPDQTGLIHCLSRYGIPAITSEQKQAGRDLVMRGGPWSAAERREIIRYCGTDVDPLGLLLDRMLPAIAARPKGLGQALLRGRFTAAAARVENNGIPIDTPMLGLFREYWAGIKTGLVREMGGDYGVYEPSPKGPKLSGKLLADYLNRNHIPWPVGADGRLKRDQDTFSEMADSYPQLKKLTELQYTLSELRLESLTIGSDCRNRTGLWPLGTKTGRNAPSSTKAVFGLAKWLRGLVKPPPGQAIASLDWESQEIAIAALLSGDKNLRTVAESGDPYIAVAVMAGLAPPGATKHTHPEQRKLCKTAFLASNYGQRAPALGRKLGIGTLAAQNLLDQLDRAFPDFTAWARDTVAEADIRLEITSELGWPMKVIPGTKTTTLKNFKAQSTGADMMRLGACLATESGIRVCWLVHDALVVEGASADIGDVARTAIAAMNEASRVVLGGYTVGVDTAVTRYPGRYADPDGETMWNRVTGIVERLRNAGPASGTGGGAMTGPARCAGGAGASSTEAFRNGPQTSSSRICAAGAPSCGTHSTGRPGRRRTP